MTKKYEIEPIYHVTLITLPIPMDPIYSVL